MRIINKFADPHFLQTFHGYATLFWIVMVIPSVLFWNSSILYLVGLSVYAVITGHWSSWQSSRVESVQDNDANVREVLEAVKRLEARLTEK